MKGEIELYNVSFLILKVELHFNTKLLRFFSAVTAIFREKEQPSDWYIFDDI